jgi:hypothetical protein
MNTRGNYHMRWQRNTAQELIPDVPVRTPSHLPPDKDGRVKHFAEENREAENRARRWPFLRVQMRPSHAPPRDQRIPRLPPHPQLVRKLTDLSDPSIPGHLGLCQPLSPLEFVACNSGSPGVTVERNRFAVAGRVPTPESLIDPWRAARACSRHESSI